MLYFDGVDTNGEVIYRDLATDARVPLPDLVQDVENGALFTDPIIWGNSAVKYDKIDRKFLEYISSITYLPHYRNIDKINRNILYHCNGIAFKLMRETDDSFKPYVGTLCQVLIGEDVSDGVIYVFPQSGLRGAVRIEFADGVGQFLAKAAMLRTQSRNILRYGMVS